MWEYGQMDEKACRILVHGSVTGVGFRYSAMREAEYYPGLKGYVRNANSRTVECVIQGSEADVKAMIRWLHLGPGTARVTDCKIVELPVDPDRPPFQIKF